MKKIIHTIMVGKVYSCTLNGLECRTIEVQADISNGLSSFTIVGLGDSSIQESKERVRSSIRNSDAKFPQTKKTINLAPAHVRKQGAIFDLPIAISILLASEQINPEKLNKAVIVGELSLTGMVKSISGTIAITQHAKEKGFEKIFLPKKNAREASLIEGIEVYPIEYLRELIDYCTDKLIINPHPYSDIRLYRGIKEPTEISKIYGLEKAKRGLQIAAAGGHNVLLYGSPGCGKTILCRAFKSLLPPMTKEEIFETTKIHSIAGNLNSENPLMIERAFREVHHTASQASIIGGGGHPKPGEITLAHNGVLFFDEIAEFPKKILECLRQPLEDRYININRAQVSQKFPSNFIFLATMNPCPCGYKGDTKIKCICSDYQIYNYQKKISGPLMDRFDIFIEIAKTPMDKVLIEKQESENLLLENIIKASKIQETRFTNNKISRNSDMELSDIKVHCKLDAASALTLEKASETLLLSNRGYLKMIKISRTIADIEGRENIEEHHLLEAIQYRSPSNKKNTA